MGSLIARNSLLTAFLTVPPLKALGFIFLGLNTSVATFIPYWFRCASGLKTASSLAQGLDSPVVGGTPEQAPIGPGAIQGFGEAI
jgi:hypothetical protein